MGHAYGEPESGQKHQVFCRQKEEGSTADLLENGDETKGVSNDMHVAYAIGGSDMPAR